tara:strand:- start:808 stop:1098 length:291 start_codon:yes stop_codon:yes gene_type:complete
MADKMAESGGIKKIDKKGLNKLAWKIRKAEAKKQGVKSTEVSWSWALYVAKRDIMQEEKIVVNTRQDKTTKEIRDMPLTHNPFASLILQGGSTNKK